MHPGRSRATISKSGSVTTFSRIGASPQRGGGSREADYPRASYSEGPQIVKALFLRIPQNALKALILNETLFGT